MKAVKITLVVLAAGFLAVGIGTSAFAFHDGGVARCTGCHSMHSPASASNLMRGTDPSSTCLNCHERAGDTKPSSYHVSTAGVDMPPGTAPLQRSPGGDFGWLKKLYTFTSHGPKTEDGATFGHDITALDKGYSGRSNNPTAAPGGTFPTASLACSSCHDPHGKYRRDSVGNVTMGGGQIIASGSYDTSVIPTGTDTVGVYRLLAGFGYQKGGVTFNAVPVAVAPATYNRTESATQTRVAYGVGGSAGTDTWGRWCRTCHPAMHSTGNNVHPVDQGLGSDVAGFYASYVKTGDMSGTLATSYSSLVPFASNTGDFSALSTLAKNDDTQLGGPVSSDQVMCLSCHRAHASGSPAMLRWYMESEFITEAGVYELEARGRTPAEAAAVYYDRPAGQFATYQRVLCNKCHAQD